MSVHAVEPTTAHLFRRLARSRRSIRAFLDEPLPVQLVEDLLCDALWAPSPHNSEPWRFTVLVDRRSRERLADAMAGQLTAELRADGLAPEVVEGQAERSRRRISSAPVAVLCSLVRDGLATYPDARRDELEWQMAVQSVGAVLQTLFLAAQARGVATCWMAAPMYCPQVVRHVLALPVPFVPQALVLMGYPAGPGKVRRRRPFQEVVDLR